MMQGQEKGIVHVRHGLKILGCSTAQFDERDESARVAFLGIPYFFVNHLREVGWAAGFLTLFFLS